MLEQTRGGHIAGVLSSDWGWLGEPYRKGVRAKPGGRICSSGEKPVLWGNMGVSWWRVSAAVAVNEMARCRVRSGRRTVLSKIPIHPNPPSPTNHLCSASRVLSPYAELSPGAGPPQSLARHRHITGWAAGAWIPYSRGTELSLRPPPTHGRGSAAPPPCDCARCAALRDDVSAPVRAGGGVGPLDREAQRLG